ncbi:acid-sensing ion channel 2-like [Antedon mediterranea]|uniref:acid-sensing ion channel 2-like n=1 Tax=Antedon mediterranea TaxID=105859 RepID=UPI003AF7C448
MSDKQSLEAEFATNTTLHGLQYIVTSKRWIFKLLWVLVFLTGLGLCVWQISLRFKEYRMFNVNTEINLTFVNELDFPAVTICNFNRYRRSALTDGDYEIIEYLWEAEEYDYFSDGSYSDGSFDYDKVFTDAGNFSTSEFTNRTGFLLNNDTLLTCKWKDKSGCTNVNFTHLYTSYGNCYTFNSGLYWDILKVRQPGSGNALQIMIDIQQDEYTEKPEGNLEAGLKVLVHSQDEPPLVESKGFGVPPGVHAFVSTRKVKVETLDQPYGHCDKSLKLQYYRVYTVSGCLLECRLKNIVEHCGCRPIRYPGANDHRECTPKETEGCASDVLRKLKNGTLEECDCPVPCAYTSFTTSVTYASIPNLSVEDELYESYNDSSAEISKNYIILDVYFEELNLQVYKQTPAMTSSALLSDIGGQLGLFIGGSVITLFEVGQYIFMKGHAVCCKGNKKRRNQQTTVAVDNKGSAYDVADDVKLEVR